MEEKEQIQENQQQPVSVQNNGDVKAERITAQEKVELSEEVIARIAEETAKSYRAMQSSMDKKARKVIVQVRDEIERMRQQGAVISEAVEKNMIEKALDEFYAGDEREEEKAKPMESFDIAFFERNRDRLFRKYNMVINAGDKEAEKRLSAAHDVDEAIDILEEILKERSEEKKSPPEARVPVAVSGGKVSASEDLYRKEILEARGDRKKVIEIKEKYRKAGLDVDSIPLFSAARR